MSPRMIRWYPSLGLGLSGGLDGIQRIADETLRAAERSRHVKAVVEAAEILGCLERLLSRGLREAKRGPKTLELTGIDVAHGRIIPPDRTAMLAGREGAPADPSRLANPPVHR